MMNAGAPDPDSSQTTPDSAPRPPATEAEVQRLIWRLRAEVGLTNVVGAAVLIVGAVLFDPPAREESGDIIAAFWSLLLVLPAIAAGIWGTHRLVRPLLDWLRHGQAGTPAPERVQRLVLAHPALQALILLGLWLITALVLALIDAAILGGSALGGGAEQPLREFLTTLAGISVAGMVVSTLSFLADQRVLGPWYDRFFADADPTSHDIPSTKVRRRLIVVFVLGTAIPLLLVGAVVSERLADPTGVGQLEGIVWFLVAVGIGTSLSLLLSVRQSITRPLELIRGAADQVRRGDLTASVPVESPDELGEVAVAFNAMVEGLRERRRVEDLLGRQVGDSVAEKVLHEGVSFDVERRTASVLFLDLAGFTRLAEDLPPESVVGVLNRMFEIVIREVDSRQGLVNKFMGDAVLAVFGAPLDEPNHARHAVDAARAIAVGLTAEGVQFGIGISTGNVVAGNVGAARRFEYTVVGDAVNEAARLQELTRDRDETVLVSGRTVEALSRRDGLTPLGTVELRGRSTPTALYGMDEG